MYSKPTQVAYRFKPRPLGPLVNTLVHGRSSHDAFITCFICQEDRGNLEVDERQNVQSPCGYGDANKDGPQNIWHFAVTQEKDLNGRVFIMSVRP